MQITIKKFGFTFARMQINNENLRLQKMIAFIAVILFVVKFVAWYLTHSLAILTDALESIVNVLAAFLGVYSLYVSGKPKDKDHPYGHGKIEFISSAVEGTLIMVAGGLIIYKAIREFGNVSHIEKLDSGIILVSVTALINYIAGTICLRKGRRNNSLPLISSGKHLQSDTWSTVGLVIGLILIYATGYHWLDHAVAVVFALFIMYMGYTIIRSSVAGIMDEADIELLRQMVAMLNRNRPENWIDLHNLRIIKYGSTLHMDCHLTVPWYLNVQEAHAEIEALAALIKKEYGQAVELFVHSDPCVEFSCRICMKQNCAVRQDEFERKVEWTIENISRDTKHRIKS